MKLIQLKQDAIIRRNINFATRHLVFRENGSIRLFLLSLNLDNSNDVQECKQNKLMHQISIHQHINSNAVNINLSFLFLRYRRVLYLADISCKRRLYYVDIKFIIYVISIELSFQKKNKDEN